MFETLEFIPALPSLYWVLVTVGAFLFLEVSKMIYFTKFHALKKVPGPWFPGASSLWLRWQRWNGKLSFTADDLLSQYGPIVRISPKMVLLNDSHAVESVFSRKDLDTAPVAIRALRVGGHEWTVTYPQNHIARERRLPVMIATTTKNLKYWHSIFEENTTDLVRNLGASRGMKSEDIVHHLRVTTLYNSQLIMGGAGVNLDARSFPKVVGEYNFLVVWRLCLPEWLFTWLKFSPFSHPRFRVRSSDLLFKLGEDLCKQAEATGNQDDAPSIYQLFTKKNEKDGGINWNHAEISAEMAGQVLAATETTSSALAFIFYELAKNPGLVEEVYEELQTVQGYNNLESLKLLDACVKEGLRFRPPVAFTGSRLSPKGGLDILGYHIPAGTVVTTQSLSMSRQRPDLFPNCDVYDPTRWLDQDKAEERRRLLVPFGVGARRCPGGNLAIYQMRLTIAAIIRAFKISVAPETTPISMAPFEANGFRSRLDQCHLIFTPRELETGTTEVKANQASELFSF